MKFKCDCGHIIYDSADYLSYKAHIISDQDWFDYLEKIEMAVEKLGTNPKDKEIAIMEINKLSLYYSKSIYQCKNCGNIFIPNGNNTFNIFKNDSIDENKNILSSVEGDKWKGTIFAEWIDDKPEWMETNGYIYTEKQLYHNQNYDTWEELECKYYSLFEQLRKNNTLRSSVLKRNRNIIHSWQLGLEE